MPIFLPMVIECPKCCRMFSKGQSTKMRYRCPHCSRYIYIWEVKRFFESNTDSHNGSYIIECDYMEVSSKLYKIMRSRGININEKFERMRCEK